MSDKEFFECTPRKIFALMETFADMNRIKDKDDEVVSEDEALSLLSKI